MTNEIYWKAFVFVVIAGLAMLLHLHAAALVASLLCILTALRGAVR